MNLKELAIQETYQDCEGLIRSAVWRFMRKYGDVRLSFDDLFQEACLIFLKTYGSYDPGRTAFSTWLCVKVHYGLLTLFSKNRDNMLPSELLDRLPGRAGPSFRLPDFLEELSPDARDVVALVLRYRKPPDRKMVKEKLAGRGWSGRRISRCFKEIRETLS